MGGIVTAGAQLPGAYLAGEMLRVEPIGEVYEAIPTRKGQRRAQAVVLHPMFEAVLGPWFAQMAGLHERVSHPNLVERFAFGTADGGLSAMVVEWLEGTTLRERLKAEGPLPIEEGLRVLRALAASLDYLHEQSPTIVHRALTPENVLFLEPDHRVKLVGLGDCDRVEPAAAAPRYLAPEEFAAPEKADAASDVFSLATLTYELFRAEPAFGNSEAEVIDAARSGRVPKLGRASRDPLSDFDPLLRRAWSLAPRERFGRASEFVGALREVWEQRKLARATPLEISAVGSTTATRAAIPMVEPERVANARSEMPPPVPAPANHLRSPTLPGARGRGDADRSGAHTAFAAGPVRPVSSVVTPEPEAGRSPSSLAAVIAEVTARRLGPGMPTPYRGVPVYRPEGRGEGAEPVRRPEMGLVLAPPMRPEVDDAEHDPSERPTQVMDERVVPRAPLQRSGETPQRSLTVSGSGAAPTGAPSGATRAPWEDRGSWDGWAPDMGQVKSDVARPAPTSAPTAPSVAPRSGIAVTQTTLALLLVALPLLIALVVILVGRLLR